MNEFTPTTERFEEKLSENVSSFRYVAFDTETTGVDIHRDHLVELAAVAFDEEFEHRHFEEFARPPIAIPAGAGAVHGITDEMVQSAASGAEVIGRFFEFLKTAGSPRVLLAHNCGFDLGIISGECARATPTLRGGLDSDPKSLPKNLSENLSEYGAEIVLDTCVMARSLLPNLERHRLQDLGAYFKVKPPAQYHRAMADVEVLRQSFLGLLGLAADRYTLPGGGLTLNTLVNIAGGYFLFDPQKASKQKLNFQLSPLLQSLQNLCGSEARVGIMYGLEEDYRYITPIELQTKSSRVYLKALCHRENIKKTFRADRILKIAL